MPNPVHIRAKRTDIAPLVIAAGDPARTAQLAGMLEGAKIVNTNRGFITYTGHYNSRRITIATHGVGGPSSAVVFEELRMLGATSIVRLGTSGAMVRELGIGDFIVPTGAAHPGGSAATGHTSDGVLPPVPDFGLTEKLIQGCRSRDSTFLAGLVFSSDSFYGEDRAFLKRWASRGVIGVEMECATLFTLGTLRRFRTASLLIVSNSLVRRGEKEMVTSASLEPKVEEAGKIVLEALSAEA
jgi:5'-methylthioadenosine phosphorylase